MDTRSFATALSVLLIGFTMHAAHPTWAWMRFEMNRRFPESDLQAVFLQGGVHFGGIAVPPRLMDQEYSGKLRVGAHLDAKILAVYDFLASWFAEETFRGAGSSMHSVSLAQPANEWLKLSGHIRSPFRTTSPHLLNKPDGQQSWGRNYSASQKARRPPLLYRETYRRPRQPAERQ